MAWDRVREGREIHTSTIRYTNTNSSETKRSL